MAFQPPPPFKLTSEKKRVLQELQGVVADLEERISKARQANIPVTEHEKNASQLKAQIDGILRVYS